jgi:hypothetical protein
MLSNASRWLMVLNALLYAVPGILLFLLPERLAPVFAWKVTGFMTMTIGGCCLRNAWLAWWTARVRKWHLSTSGFLILRSGLASCSISRRISASVFLCYSPSASMV